MKRNWSIIAFSVLLSNIACDNKPYKDVSDAVDLVDSLHQEIEAQGLSKIAQRIPDTTPEDLMRMLDSAGIDTEETRRRVEDIARRVEASNPSIIKEVKHLSEKVTNVNLDSILSHRERISPSSPAAIPPPPDISQKSDTVDIQDQVQDIAERVIAALGNKKTTPAPSTPPEKKTNEPIYEDSPEPPAISLPSPSDKEQKTYDSPFRTIDRTPYTVKLDISQTRDTDIQMSLENLAHQYGGVLNYFSSININGKEQVQALISVPYRDYVSLISDLQREIGDVNQPIQPKISDNQQPEIAKLELNIRRPDTIGDTAKVEESSWIRGILNVLSYFWKVILFSIFAIAIYLIYINKKKKRQAREEAERLESERQAKLHEENLRKEMERLELEQLRQQVYQQQQHSISKPDFYKEQYSTWQPEASSDDPVSWENSSKDGKDTPPPSDPYEAYRPKEENRDKPSPFPMNPKE